MSMLLPTAPEGATVIPDAKQRDMSLLIIHSPRGARPLETPPEVREEAKTTTERKVG